MLFGGRTITGHVLNDTWVFKNGSWQNITSTLHTAPPPLWGAGMTYDPSLRGLLLFGGRDMRAEHQATWKFANGSWTNLGISPAASPPGVDTMLLAHDSVDGYDLLYGGTQGGVGTNETWKFANSTWTNLNSSSIGAPPTMVASGGGFDAGLKAVLLYVPQYTGKVGGSSETWKYVNGTWTQLSTSSVPESHFYPAITPDAAIGGTLLFGGLDSFVDLPLNDTWAYVGGVWTNESSSVGTEPPDRGAPAATYDPHLGGVLIFGGYAVLQGESDLGDTWVYKSAPSPSVNATATPPDAEANLRIDFNATPFGRGAPPYTYGWTFGDGTGAAGANTSHSYSRAGTYVARVTITDSNGSSNSSSVRVEIVPDATVSILFQPAVTESQVLVNFSANVTLGIPPFAYQWSFGDSITAAQARVSHAYATSGTYPIHLTVTDAAGVRSEANASIVVVSRLSAVWTTPYDPGEALFTLPFAAAVVGGLSPFVATWDFGDGQTASGENVTHTYARDGTYTVQLSVTDSAHVQSISKAVEVILPPVSVVVTPSAPTIDVGAAAPFDAVVSGGIQPYVYEWTYGAGRHAAGASLAVTFGTAGPESVRLTVTDALGATTVATLNFTVEPKLSLRVLTNESSGMIGVPIRFSAEVSGGSSPFSIHWDFGDGGAATGPLANHSYLDPGAYSISATVTDAAGVSVTGTASVMVNASGEGPNSPCTGCSATNAYGTPLIWAGLATGIALAVGVGALMVLRRRSRPFEPSEESAESSEEAGSLDVGDAGPPEGS